MVSNRAKVEKNIQIIQNDKEWQLSESTALMSIKVYKESGTTRCQIERSIANSLDK